MDTKKLYDFLFELYDYADYLVGEIAPGNPDNNNYFLSLVYIEDMMDKYGRGLINSTARKINPEDDKSLEEAHSKIDLLRNKIDKLNKEYGFKDAVIARTELIARDYSK